MRVRTPAVVVLIVAFAVVLQTTLFARISFVTPDFVMLVSILFALTRLRPEAVLALAFVNGLLIDLIGSSLLGLRAIVFTIVAYIAVRTRERAEIGRPATAIWAGLLTLLGVVLLVLIGTLFGDTALLGDGALRQVLLVPLANLVVAALIAPWFVRLVNGDRTSLRYA